MTGENDNGAAAQFKAGLWSDNPVLVQLLGMCPTLAITNSVENALVMGAAATFVVVCSNLITSLLRPLIRPHVRILIFTLTIATFVTIADRFLAAYMYTMSKELGPYVPLIIVNCVIICRCEVCASKQGVLTAARALCEFFAERGHNVVSGQLHGMAQRGGSVQSSVVIDSGISPVIARGRADFVVGFEPAETVRALPFNMFGPR